MPERTIVQYGVYQFDDSERQAYRLRLFSQVIRHPGNEYLNTKYQKHQSFYGYAQLMNGDFVHQVVQIEYEKQCLFEFVANDNWNTLVSGSYQYGILLTISNAVVALGGTPLTLVEPALPLFPLPYDRVVVKLFNNTTLVLFTEVVAFPELPNVSSEFDPNTASPTPPSSTQPEANPEDEPYDTPTEPYDIPTADNGETYNPQRPESGQGTPGQRYRIYFMIQRASDGSNLVGGNELVYAPYGNPSCRLDGNGYSCFIRQIGLGTEVRLGGASIPCTAVITYVEPVYF